MSLFSLQNPESILITGASGGLGGALARSYAAPDRILLLQGRDGERLSSIAAACRDRGARVEMIACDLRHSGNWTAVLRDLTERQPIDLAIVNAGVTSSVDVASGLEDWVAVQDVMDVNLNAALATVHVLAQAMRQRGCGQIALISSLSAYFGLPVTPSYCASKAALKAYGESLRGSLAGFGIAVNVVLPGFVETDMSARFPGPKPFQQSPDTAAAVVRRGLARNRARIAFPAPLSWGMWWLSVLPPGVSLGILKRLGFCGRPTPNA
jgi:short-subunit dehydrogenase